MNLKFVCLAAALAGLSLQGCAIGGLQDTLGSLQQPQEKLMVAGPEHLMPIEASIMLRTISGPPEAAQSQLLRSLDKAATDARMALIVDGGATPTDASLQLYMVAAKERQKVTISYVWDVFDRMGNRMHRSSGQEVINIANPPADVWSIVPPDIYDRVAGRGIAAVVMPLATQRARNVPVSNAVASAPNQPALSVR